MDLEIIVLSTLARGTHLLYVHMLLDLSKSSKVFECMNSEYGYKTGYLLYYRYASAKYFVDEVWRCVFQELDIYSYTKSFLELFSKRIDVRRSFIRSNAMVRVDSYIYIPKDFGLYEASMNYCNNDLFSSRELLLDDLQNLLLLVLGETFRFPKNFFKDP